MSTVLLDVNQLKKFDDAKRHKETIWSGDDGNITLLGLKPGQEIITHTHHGSHIFVVIEGEGEYLTGGKSQPDLPRNPHSNRWAPATTQSVETARTEATTANPASPRNT